MWQRVLKVEVWVIAKAFTFVLNCVIIACVMNQSEGHWQLFDVFNTCINLKLTLEVEVGHATDVLDVFDDVELFIFQNRMQA